ncbi:uncharacterized protein LOC496746 precursor [Xenopus tropicalis]|uniref:Hypothetical LOC496746 n=1 Tax=Xenopus tropicalis TaxID=8364 RepID=Q5M8I3_XENTR|nr:uncharacterized protein LOC496746 precursor [Xenopus tropicalis]AAH88011.1 hypothetical LOC496746 [Xenopus tropicalis]|eukprot:NP_001011293.1 uncharacterized protein LOC496746 precursor [Xenopus tropicalis]
MPIWVLLFLGVVAASPLVDDKIIGEYECAPHSQKWQVYFTYKGYPWCGGSLISSRWIISAASCNQSPKYLIAHLGKHDITREEGTEQHIQVEKTFPHNRYLGLSDSNNIMLVKLAEPAQFNQFVQPIKVASSCPREGKVCQVSGFGNLNSYAEKYPDRLQCLDLPILPESSCDAYFSPKKMHTNLMCAGFAQDDKDSCQGDAGGPLICKGELYGIILWGNECSGRGIPGVYLKVCNFTNWMQNIINNN